MFQFTGVTHVPDSLDELKRLALLFDKVFLWDLRPLRRSPYWSQRSAADRATLEWLEENEVISVVNDLTFESSELQDSRARDELDRMFATFYGVDGNGIGGNEQIAELTAFATDVDRQRTRIPNSVARGIYISRMAKELVPRISVLPETAQERFLRQVPSRFSDLAALDFSRSVLAALMATLNETYDGGARVVPARLRETQLGIEAVPVVTSLNSAREKVIGSADVVQFTLGTLPIPSDRTAWEAIEDFRRDHEARNKLLRLRRWMRQIGSTEIQPNHFLQEYEWLLSEYEEQVRLHRLKNTSGRVETFVVASVEFVANVVKLNWGEAARGLFSLSRRRVGLLEAERNFVGNELAYIVHAKGTFRDR